MLGMTHQLVAMSLVAPTITQNSRGDYLVRIGRAEAFLGYFPASLVEDKVGFRTFFPYGATCAGSRGVAKRVGPEPG